jgi:hypothetical protein
VQGCPLCCVRQYDGRQRLTNREQLKVVKVLMLVTGKLKGKEKEELNKY